MIKSYPLYRDPLFWLSVLLSFFALTLSANAEEVRTRLSGELRVNNTLAPNVVVYLLPEVKGSLPIEPVTFTLIQKELAFFPDFSVVPMGSTLVFENQDDTIHNARSNGPSNRFNIGSQLPKTLKEVLLEHDGVVPIVCSVHPEMSALVYVSPSPYFAKTDSKGRFEIQNIKPGNYTIAPWHESLSRREVAAGRKKITLEKPSETVFLKLMAMGGLETDMSMVSKADWLPEVEAVELALEVAFSRWENKHHTSATAKVMRTQSALYQESGLRNAIAKGLGEPRALALEKRFDEIRKSVQGLKKGQAAAGLKQDIQTLVSDLKKDAEVLKAR